ncbi:AAA domain-containing protein [Bacteroides sp. 224]|uniref:AAA domain-containing protein n=1 Tax=Bacteroides sp. 224 TaxID=2302936 RepID=UPI0013D6D79F|nr:AAA domain-containing protein [Bacteroides sp. 224]NDV67123.1 hypothetical protein [Bacteroides sp. 224]
MALYVYKISEYDHVAEKKQFDEIQTMLESQYSDSSENCILIANYNIEGIELDALLITSGGFRILEFKNWGGNIIARENGSWTSNGLIIEGGAGKKTPYEQIRLNKSRVSKGLKNLLGIVPQTISAVIIFWKDSNIDTTQLSSTVKTWLSICDNTHIAMILEGLNNQHFTSEYIVSLPSLLKIEDFDIENNQISTTNEIYEPEASTNFYEELESALKQIPNYTAIYKAYNRTFQKCLNQKTSSTKLNLGGPFAKTDYLLKEHNAPRNLAKSTNDTRVRLRKSSEIPDDKLQKYYLYDLKNLCEFIAYIYQSKIPDTLSHLFPKEKLVVYTPTLISECMRVIIEQWDEEFVYGHSEESTDGELIKICYASGNLIYNYDWTYLKNIFYKGAQLNLIRPRKNNDTIFPELIIFEPDYLVDISTISRCFTNYAESPFVNLINKISPAQNTESIILGNLASQLLDETIHQLPNTHPYAQSVMDFFKDNVLSLITVKIDSQFHDNAKKQKQNILQAINTILPTKLKRFNSKDGIVEPSFFSEMLGMQGRMDYLQLDFRVLIEQKSGKGDYPYNNFVTPKHKEEHYVQMLLYMALVRYNYRDIYEKNGKELYAFLLYSKYSESLLGLGFAPELIFRAIKIRNGLAWTEILYTQPNGYRILDSLTPEKINTKKTNDSLWLNFQQEQIANILSPIQQASELERAYYFRFLTFIANEHLMSKLGNKTKENSGFASKWHDSLEEKLQAGNIYYNLRLLSPDSKTEGKIKTVTLCFSETNNNDMSNFRVGDIVILYPYSNDQEPDIRSTMVFRCTIEDLQTKTINLKLRAAQSDGRAFIKEAGKLWAIEHDFMESSYSPLYRGMHAFLSAPKERRDLLMLQREPVIDNSLTLKGDYNDFNDLSLHIKKAKDLFLIIGPPGTGKTSFGLLNTVKEELLETESSILLMSYTNRAVDEICSKLYQEKIDFVRIGGKSNCATEYRDKLLSSRAKSFNNIAQLKEELVSIRVFVGTTASLNSNISLLQLKSFSLAIIDEASQILEPHLIGLLSAHNNGVPVIKKFVMIGDHKQLPAVVQQKPEVSIVHDVTLVNILLKDCRLSLFERLYRKYAKNKDVVFMLTRQGRMHHDIAMFPNYTFYNNQLKEVPLSHQNIELPHQCIGVNGIIDLLKTRRIAFIAVKSSEESPSDKVNQAEADIIAATVIKIHEIEKDNFDINKTVGVIVPYRNQIATIRNTIDKYGINDLHNITIDTVERYQGSQRKYIIYGFTIQKYYQLHFLTNNVFEDTDGSIIDRKLNVAITRAEEHLLLVGNPELLSNNFTFFKLIEFIRSRHGYLDVNKDDYVAGRFNVSPYETEAVDLSKATYTTTQVFNNVFEKNILHPVKDASDDQWPSKVFGYDMATNLNTIGYGRINFSNQMPMFDDIQISPERQVQIYCYYIMRQHYCSSKNIYTSFKDWLGELISFVQGRLQMIDIGCGPATCGIAFSEIFLHDAPNMVYTGIDISTEMKKMGKQLLEDIHHGHLHYQMKDSFNALDSIYWDGCSELPSLILFNMSYFFSNVNAQFTEQLALQISEVMKKYPLNKYVFFIQHSDCDKKLNSYKIFRRILNSNTVIIKQEDSSFSYILNHKERRLPFCFEIFTNK